MCNQSQRSVACRAILIIDNSHGYMSICICKITISMNGSFFPHPCIMNTEQTFKNIFTYKL